MVGLFLVGLERAMTLAVDFLHLRGSVDGDRVLQYGYTPRSISDQQRQLVPSLLTD
jgi:hypothetical protein